MTPDEALAKYPHLVNLPLAAKLHARRLVIEHLDAKMKRAATAKVNANDETYFVKAVAFSKVQAVYTDACHGNGWMKHYARLTK